VKNTFIHKQTSHGLWRSAGCNMPTHTHFFQWAILTRKVGHTDLVFGVPSGFISRSVHTRLQVSVCSGYDLCHIQTDTDNIWPVYTKSSVNWSKTGFRESL